MIIVLEGPDGGGKTTLAKHLEGKYGWKYFHSGKPMSRDDMKKLYIDLEFMAGSQDIYVVDRAPFISDLVYSKIFEKPLLADLKTHMEAWSICKLMIYCMPHAITKDHVSTEHKAHKPAEYTEQVKKKHEQILNAYEDLFRRKDQFPFPSYRYDGLVEGNFEKLCFWIGEQIDV